MSTGYLESEGQQEYANIGIPFPKTINDELYDRWLHDTSAVQLLL